MLMNLQYKTTCLRRPKWQSYKTGTTIFTFVFKKVSIANKKGGHETKKSGNKNYHW
jgi:hypothetical protein